MPNGYARTLVEEVLDTMPGAEKDIAAQLSSCRILACSSQVSDSIYLLRLVSLLAKRMDWEMFEPGSAPIISLHYGSIYSFKDFAHIHTGMDEADAVVIGTSTDAALEMIVSIVENLALENFIKFEQDEEAISKALHIIPLFGLLSYNTWIEPSPVKTDYEPIDRRHEFDYGLEIKRPRDCVEGDLFAAALDESAALKLLLKTVARRGRREPVTPPEGISRAWELLGQSRQLLNYGCFYEAGVVAGTALEELLIALTNMPYAHIKRDRIALGKIISIVERNKKLIPAQTKILREFAELRTECAHAIIACPKPDNDLSLEVTKFIEWLDGYPDWLR